MSETKVTPAERSGGFAAGTLNTSSSTITISSLDFTPRIIKFTLLRTDSAYAIFSTGTAFGTATQFGSSIAIRITGTTGVRSSSSTTDSLIISSNTSGTPVALGRVTDVSPNGFTVTMSTPFNIDWGWEAYA